jgi:hypothetical protein
MKKPVLYSWIEGSKNPVLVMERRVYIVGITGMEIFVCKASIETWAEDLFYQYHGYGAV